MRPKDFVVYGSVVFFLVDVAHASRGRVARDHLHRTAHNGSECFMLGCGPPISPDTNSTTDCGDHCLTSKFLSQENSRKLTTGSIWGYSVVACLLVSAVGLGAVAIIPLMHKVLFNHVLQFLVALAIGSLASDALLHLLPHALIPHSHDHSHEHDLKNASVSEGNHKEAHDEEIHRNAVWLGMTSLGGIFLFFIVERSIGLYSEWRRIRKEKSKEEKPNPLATSSEIDHVNTDQMVLPMKSLARGSRHEAPHSCNEKLVVIHSSKGVQKFADDAHDEMHRNCDRDMMESSMSWDNRRTVSGHEHSHAVPGTVSSVAWMVIIGDGFHNFADGIAIGSSFSTGLSYGLGTSIAVFCHEVPHELGDFAMLLNAGMSAKQALVYNSVSCVLCFIGMACGIAVGNVVVSRQWIFAVIAGMFLYIALVDMLPEMRSVDPKKGENPLIHLALQLAGMLSGILVMLMIALFEDQLNVV